MAEPKPFTDEELKAIEEFNQPKETQCQTMIEASMIYAEEKRKAYIRRFLDTIAARDKRIEELEHECLIHKTDYGHSHAMRMVAEEQVTVRNDTIADQTATIERLRGALDFYSCNTYEKNPGECARQAIGKE
jgi:hypothetical protein